MREQPLSRPRKKVWPVATEVLIRGGCQVVAAAPCASVMGREVSYGRMAPRISHLGSWGPAALLPG